jgi:nucleotide-binding universal stress UspA family protein
MYSQIDPTLAHIGPTFASIVCGVDGSSTSHEAALQAALLADEGTALTYVAVSWEQGVGASAAPKDARDGLCRAQDRARAIGVHSSVVNEQSDDPARRLLEIAAGHDLLVLESTGHSRTRGIMAGSEDTAAVHRSAVPVLVARRPPEGVAFPARIILASDGTPMSDAAAEFTARIAARHGAHVAIVGARDHEAPFRPGLAEHATQIKEATGTEPLILDQGGPPHDAVAIAARDFGASLIVTGSRGLTGVSALRSVSERIAHAAPCSVLVVRS